MNTILHEARLYARRLQTDFHAFARHALQELAGQSIDGGHRWLFCEIVASLAKRGMKRVIVNAPPESQKGWICGAMHAAFSLGQHPRRSVLIIAGDSATLELHAKRCELLLRSEWYSEVFPRTRLIGPRNGDLLTTQGGTIMFRTLSTVRPTDTADQIILDCPESEDDVRTDAQRARTAELAQRAFSLLKHRGTILLLSHRLHADDLTARLLTQGFKRWSFPLIAEARMIHMVGDFGFKRLPGNVLDTSRWPSWRVDWLRRSLSEDRFAAHYQQEPLTPAS